jgi:nucleotide-binding universal stress UspA family protein
MSLPTMKPFRKILVPVDFSAYSLESLDYAVELARRFEATIGIVYVYQPTSYAVPDSFELFSPSQLAAMESEFERRLQATRDEVVASGIENVETRLLMGMPATEIVSYAEANAYDLIVMGTHGRSGFGHALLGSVAEKVVRQAPCPVLTVRLPKAQ